MLRGCAIGLGIVAVGTLCDRCGSIFANRDADQYVQLGGPPFLKIR